MALKIPHFLGEQLYVLTDVERPNLDIPVEKTDVLVCVDCPIDALSADHRDTITKMMVGIKRADSYLIVGLEADFIPLNQMIKSTEAQYVLAFGLTPSKLLLNVSPIANQILNLGKEKILFSEGVALFDVVEKKKQLWSRLKLMFQID